MLNHLNKKPVKPERVVIMGANGFVGNALYRTLRNCDINVLPLAKSDINLLEPDAAEKLANMMQTGDCLVAVSAIAPCKDLHMLRDNLTIIESFCAAIRKVKLGHILNIGSDAIYADSNEALTEKSCASPGSLHGIMHLIREVMLREAADGIPFATLRSTLIYGVDDPHNGYGPNRFLRLAARGEDIILFGEGEERRDHVFVDDVVNLITHMLMHRSIGILNAATGEVTSFRNIAELVISLFDTAVKIKGSPRNGPMPHNGYRPFDPSATLTAFPDFQYATIEEGLYKTYKQIMEKSNG